jgi:hypothetical protein
MNPTKEQEKRFWEWCGFTENLGGVWRYAEFKTTNYWWVAPTGRKYLELPQPDLNNLFKYAVPRYIKETSAGDTPNYIGNAYRRLFNQWLEQLHWDNWRKPEQSLFKVINKLIEQ